MVKLSVNVKVPLPYGSLQMFGVVESRRVDGLEVDNDFNEIADNGVVVDV